MLKFQTPLCNGARQLSDHSSITGLKVPLDVRCAADTAGQVSGQPESKGSSTSLVNQSLVQQGLTSGRMAECCAIDPHVSLSDQEARTVGNVVQDQSYVSAPFEYGGNPVHISSSLSNECEETPIQSVLQIEEVINSQELLARGNKTLLKQLIEERQQGCLQRSSSRDCASNAC
jgi:hypothetical protein